MKANLSLIMWLTSVALIGGAARADTVRTYAYDSQGRVTRIECGGRSVSYAYDYQGRLYSRTENGGNGARKHLYSGAQVVAEYGAGGKRYLCGPGIDNVLAFHDGSARYLHRDGLGSVTLATDGSNEVLERVSYDAFGEPTFRDAEYGPAESATGNRQLFTGREWEAELGLYNYRARFYAPGVGRFVSPDPIGVSGGLNLYAYCGNNPVNLVDPFGTEACESDQAREDQAAVAAFQQYYNPYWNNEISFFLNPYGVVGPITIGSEKSSGAGNVPAGATGGAHSHSAELASLEEEHGFGERDEVTLRMLSSGYGIDHAYLVDGSTRKVLRMDAANGHVSEVGTIIVPTIPENPSINNLPNWLAARYEQALFSSPDPSEGSWQDVDRTQNAWTPWPESQTRTP